MTLLDLLGILGFVLPLLLMIPAVAIGIRALKGYGPWKLRAPAVRILAIWLCSVYYLATPMLLGWIAGRNVGSRVNLIDFLDQSWTAALDTVSIALITGLSVIWLLRLWYNQRTVARRAAG